MYQQTQRWLKAGCFEAMAHDLRMFITHGNGSRPDAHSGRDGQPDVAIDSGKRQDFGIDLVVAKHT